MISAVEHVDVDMFDTAAVAADDHGTILALNEMALGLFGYGAKEVVGQNLKMLMPASVAQHHDIFLAQYRKNHDRRLIGKARVVNIRCKDGSEPECTIRLGEYMEGKKLRFIGAFSLEDVAEVSELVETEHSAREQSIVDTSSSAPWYGQLHHSEQDSASLPQRAKLSSRERQAFRHQTEFWSGLLSVKVNRSWKEHWVVVDRLTQTCSVFSATSAMKEVESLSLRALGKPLKKFKVVDSVIREASGITGRENSFSICEKGGKIRFFVCPTSLTCRLWVSELKVTTTAWPPLSSCCPQ